MKIKRAISQLKEEISGTALATAFTQAKLYKYQIEASPAVKGYDN